MSVAVLALIALLTAAAPSEQEPKVPPAAAPIAPIAPGARPMTKPFALGDTLPKGLSLRALDGKVVEFDALRGKVVVLHFWSTTCAFDTVAQPKFHALVAEFAGKDVVLVGVAANANELGAVPDPQEFAAKDPDKLPYARLRARAKECKLEHAIVVDHDAALGRLLDAKTTPHCFVFDAEGKLQYQGALDDDGTGKVANPTRYVRDAVVALLAGQKPAVQTTKPYGSRTKFAPRPALKRP